MKPPSPLREPRWAKPRRANAEAGILSAGLRYPIQLAENLGAMSVRETYQPCKARLSVCSHVGPQLAGLGSVHDRSFDPLHLSLPALRSFPQ